MAKPRTYQIVDAANTSLSSNTAISNAHDQANTAYAQANSAYAQANSAYSQANTKASIGLVIALS